MATKSVLKTSASALLALLLGTAALLPAAANAQERPDRGERGSGRMERVERSAPAQAPAWQNRAPAANSAPAWQGRAPTASSAPAGQGRPAWSSNGGQPARPSPPANPGGWNGRPAWQNGGGDRGSVENRTGQPTNGRPAWAQGGQVQQPRTQAPAWGNRNPTYVDPNRGRNGWQGSNGRDRDGRDRDGRDGDRSAQWHRDGNGQWARNGWGSNNQSNWNRDRDRNRDRNRDRDGWRGNGWRGNSWGYNNGGRTWDRDGWRRDNRYDWSGWRNRHRSIFSLGFYSAPWRDYSYSRFGIGVVIGAPFYDQRYWIADPWAYRLPPADGPYRWVRYYDDALLVDIYSGEVVDVIYDIFY